MSITDIGRQVCNKCDRDMALHIRCSYACGRYICPDEDGQIVAYEPNDDGVRTSRGWVCNECIAEDAQRHVAANVESFIKGVRFAMQRGDL